MTEFMESSYYLDSDLQFESKMVWCIEEIDYRYEENNNIYTRLFIYYDQIDDYFYIVGKRPNTTKQEYAPFHFKTQSVKGVVSFLKFTVGSEMCNITLYNYNNIYNSETDMALLPYEFFESNMDINYEISGYDNIFIDGSKVKKMVKLLKSFD
jgi:hypothetical protein